MKYLKALNWKKLEVAQQILVATLIQLMEVQALIVIKDLKLLRILETDSRVELVNNQE